MDGILKAHFDRFMKKGELPPELRENNMISGCRLFDDEEKLKEWRNNFKGLQYTDKKTGIMLHGAIDNLLVKGKKLVVLDYKTRGFPLKEDTHEHYQAQMDLYNFLLRKNGYETEDYTFLLFYYPSCVKETGEVVFETFLKKIETSAEKGEKIFEEAMKILKGEIPDAADECEFCKWPETRDRD
jgi:RecB family exonuclease